MKFYNQKLTLASSLFVVLSGLSSQLWAGNYYAVVDAGSSGSRLYLYKKSTDAQGNPVAESLPLTGNKVKPGISVYVNQLAQVGDYIEPLLNTLDAELKSKGIPQSEVNFSLMATAGMRVESPNLQTAVYDEVKAKVKAMLPGVNIQYVLTIQGRYEGAFQWLTVNYLNGNLASGAETTCMLETGGGSYQMTWQTSSKLKNSIDVFSLNYGNTPYTLFSESFTGLGGNYSREDATDDPNSFAVGYPLVSGAIGTGNYKKGLVGTRKFIRARDISIPASVKVPALDKCIGVSLFSSVAKDLKLGDSVSSKHIDEAAKVVAATPWSVQVSEQPNNPRLFSRVDSAQLASELIRTWFPGNRELPVADAINGTELSWTLGATLFLGSGNSLPTTW